VTGDAPLTALHVAKQTTICIPNKPSVQLSNDGTKWEELHENASSSDASAILFDGTQLAKLARKYNLVVTGPGLAHAIPNLGASPFEIEHIHVFSRMSPSQKEEVVRCMKGRGLHPLMCGDGGNDVGALKQADVGVALLSGHAKSNVAQTEGIAAADAPVANAEAKLDAEQKNLAEREAVLSKKFQEEFAERRKALTGKQQEWYAEELKKITDAAGPGGPGFMGHLKAMKNSTMRIQQELGKDAAALREKYGNLYDNKDPNASAVQDDNAAGKPVVQLGDASVAAPFTSRAPSIRSVVHIIRQGRCTHLLSVQMMQIMMLEAMISAYSFTAVTMEGGRPTELQLMFSGIFVMVASVAFSYAQPADRISPVRPIKSIFHPAIFLSVIAQVSVHLFVMIKSLQLAKDFMGDAALKELYKFEEKRDLKLGKLLEGEDVSSWDMFNLIRSVPYQPNVLNTVMFLTKTSQQVAVLVVNYKGRPWMQGATENRALFISMFLCGAGLTICSSGQIPELNTFLELMVIPETLRVRVLSLLLMGTIGVFLLDRLMVFLFARDAFMAGTVQPLMQTRLQDFVPIVTLFLKVVAGFIVVPIGLGNPILGFMMIMGYRRYRASQQPQNQIVADAATQQTGGTRPARRT